MNYKFWVRISVVAVIVAGILAIYVYHEENRAKVLEVYVFNLKNSQAIFIRTPNDNRILINGGANSEIISRITKILPFYSRRIDTLMVTDNLAKNVTGLIDILNRYQVKNVYVPALTLQSLSLASSTDQIYPTFLKTAQEKELPVIELAKGDVVDFENQVANGSITVKAQILFPATSTEFAYSKASAPEIILKIEYNQTSILLLGNATTKTQKFIVAEGTTTADVLLVWNTATPDNLDAGLMNQIHPDYLVYSKSLTAPASRAPSASPKSKKPKKVKVDPLIYLLDKNRFNVRAFDYIKITSDGVSLKVDSEKIY